MPIHEAVKIESLTVHPLDVDREDDEDAVRSRLIVNFGIILGGGDRALASG